jgi:hypothetical protein
MGSEPPRFSARGGVGLVPRDGRCGFGQAGTCRYQGGLPAACLERVRQTETSGDTSACLGPHDRARIWRRLLRVGAIAFCANISATDDPADRPDATRLRAGGNLSSQLPATDEFTEPRRRARRLLPGKARSEHGLQPRRPFACRQARPLRRLQSRLQLQEPPVLRADSRPGVADLTGSIGARDSPSAASVLPQSRRAVATPSTHLTFLQASACA